MQPHQKKRVESQGIKRPVVASLTPLTLFVFASVGAVLITLSVAAPLVGLGRGAEFLPFVWWGLSRPALLRFGVITLVLFGLGPMVPGILSKFTLTVPGWVPTWVYGLLLLAASTLRFILGDSGTAFEWTTIIDIPSVLRTWDPGFLSGDFVTDAIFDSPRFAFRYLLSIPLGLGVDLQRGIYLVKVAVLLSFKPVVFLFGSTMLTRWSTEEPEGTTRLAGTRFFLFLLLAANFPSSVYGVPAGWLALESLASASAMQVSMALGLVYGTLHLSDHGGWPIRSLLLFAATLVHPVMGLGTFCLVLVFALPLMERRKVGRLLAETTIGLLLPLLWMKWSFRVEAPLPLVDFLDIYVRFRHPHHYLMSSAVNLFFAVWIAGFAILAWLTRRQRKVLASALLALGFFTLPVMLQYFGTEVLPIRAVVELGPARFTTAGSVLLILVSSLVLMLRPWSSDAPSSWYSPDRLPIRTLGSSLARLHQMLLRLGHPKSAGARYLVQSGTVLLCVCLASILPFRSPFDIDGDRFRDVIPWVADNTPAESVFFLPNGQERLANYLRVYSQRSVFVDQTFPFDEEVIVEWTQRLRIAADFVRLGPSDFSCLAKDYRVTHVVAYRSDLSPLMSRQVPLYSDDDMAVFALDTLSGDAPCSAEWYSDPRPWEGLSRDVLNP